MLKYCKTIFIVILLLPITIMAKELKSPSGPIHMEADLVRYDAQKDIIVAEGNIYIEFENYRMKVDYLYYDMQTDYLFADGNIRIVDESGRIIIGDRIEFRDKLKTGIIKNVVLKIEDSTLLAARARRIDENNSVLYKASFTPCKIRCGREPIWKINAKKTHLDFEKHQITYRTVFFHVYGVPVAFLPYFSHPTPKAPARSGLLIPSIKEDALSIPFYVRLKDNIDFTISPRVAEKYTIFELEYRHLLKHGSYRVEASSGNPIFKTITKNSQNTQKNNRYHFFINGSFQYQNLNYGLDIRRVSDKAYLKNYHDMFDSYLTSKAYVNTISGGNYKSLEAMHFQGLRADDLERDMPLIFPSFKFKEIIPLDDNDTNLIIKNELLAYNQSYYQQIGRNALEIMAQKGIQLDSGHVIDLIASNRMDMYYINEKPIIGNSSRQALYRNIPEMTARWRFPLVANISNKTTLKVEPIISTTLGRAFENRFNRYNLINSPKYDLDVENMFDSNRFSGIDYHEYGSRFNYGINNNLYSQNYELGLFLGQALHNYNVTNINDAEHVGEIGLTLLDQFKTYYKFRKDKNLRPIRDEVELGYFSEVFNVNSRLITLSNISKYFAEDNFSIRRNKIKQLDLNGGVNLAPHWFFSGVVKTDLSIPRKSRLLTRTIKVTYVKDCVSITGSITDDFTNDPRSGVTKRRTKSFGLGLKVINM